MKLVQEFTVRVVVPLDKDFPWTEETLLDALEPVSFDESGTESYASDFNIKIITEEKRRATSEEVEEFEDFWNEDQ